MGKITCCIMVWIGYVLIRKTLALCKMDFYWFISVLGVALSCYIVIWIDVDEFLYKGNDEVSKELLSQNFQNHCFCFNYKLSYNNPN